MTVSEVVFIPDAGEGECPVCHHKPVQLGHCNAMEKDDIRCIDCFFGPPSEDLYDDCEDEDWEDRCMHGVPFDEYCGECELDELEEEGGA